MVNEWYAILQPTKTRWCQTDVKQAQSLPNPLLSWAKDARVILKNKTYSANIVHFHANRKKSISQKILRLLKLADYNP